MRTSIAEHMHTILAVAPIDVTGGTTNSDVFSLRDASHVSIGVFLGVTGGTMTCTVEECDNFTPSTSNAIAFDVYKEETASGDTLGTRVAATTAGFATSANDGIFYRIEIDADTLTEGFPHLRVVLSNPGGTTIAAVIADLSGLNFQGDQTRTQIA